MTPSENPVAEISWKRTRSLSVPTKYLLIGEGGGVGWGGMG